MPNKNKPAAAKNNGGQKREPAHGKLSYNQQRLLAVLPEQIAQTEKEIEQIRADLSDPELYQNDADRFLTLTDRLEELEQKKEADENQWLEISMLAEELSAG